MSEGERIPYAAGMLIAEYLRKMLLPVCSHVEIAGSLRRKKETIGDIELVVIPYPVYDLLGEPQFGAAQVEGVLLARGLPLRKNGQYFKQTTFDNVGVDIFLTTPEKWGSVFTIRTGSAEFTHWLVTPRNKGGGCPSNMSFKDGRIWRGGVPLDTPGELDVFKALGLDYIEPEQRNGGLW